MDHLDMEVAEDVSEEGFQKLTDLLTEEASTMGLEVAPFRLGWYNAKLIDTRFRIDGDNDTLCYVIISAPSMFEKAFVPYLRGQLQSPPPENDNEDYDNGTVVNDASISTRDPLDACMRCCFRRLIRTVKRTRQKTKVKALHDFEVSPVTKRPKILVQTAGHVSGAVRFYRWADVQTDPGEIATDQLDWRTGKGKMFPVCVHPKYGGWFALRGVLILDDTRAQGSYLSPREPPEILAGPPEIKKLLHLFNEHWRDGRYRELGRAANSETYSEVQREYFGLEPKDRPALIQRIILGLAGVTSPGVSNLQPPPFTTTVATSA